MGYFTHDANRRFDRRTAYRLAHIADLSYLREVVDEPRDVQEQWVRERLESLGMTPDPGAIRIFENVSSDTEGMAITFGRDMVLAFRGTEPKEIRDWFSDLRATHTFHPWGRLHDGFADAYRSALESVLDCIRDLPGGGRIWLTGHSLGGALATLWASALSIAGYTRRIGAVYTFGSPRVGDHGFMKRYDERLLRRTVRFVNDQDVVARLPPRAMGFQHVGRRVHFDDQGNNQTSDRNGRWWNGFWERLYSTLDDATHPTELIGDHSCSNYIELLAPDE